MRMTESKAKTESEHLCELRMEKWKEKERKLKIEFERSQYKRLMLSAIDEACEYTEKYERLAKHRKEHKTQNKKRLTIFDQCIICNGHFIGLITGIAIGKGVPSEAAEKFENLLSDRAHAKFRKKWREVYFGD